MLYEAEQMALQGILDSLAEDFTQAMYELGIRRWQKGSNIHLLVWRQVAMEYNVSFIYVTKLVVTRYRKLMDRSGPVLGLAFNIITGPKAVAWLREELRPERQLRKPSRQAVAKLRQRLIK